MKDIHLMLPDPVARELDRLAGELNETRNGLIRRALEHFFEAERARRLADEMREYARTMADHSGEFVEETEPEVIRKLLEETEW